MFDIGFSELLLTAVIALVVIGPKRLPETIRTIGLWVGRTKRALNRAYQEMERELGLDDIRRQLHNEEVMRSLEEHKKQLEEEILGRRKAESDKAGAEAISDAKSPAPAAGESSVTVPLTENTGTSVSSEDIADTSTPRKGSRT